MAKLNMSSGLFQEMIDTVKGAIPSEIVSQEVPGVLITVTKDGTEVLAETHSPSMSVKSERYPLNSGEAGVFHAPASWLLKAISKLPNTATTMESKGNDIVLKSGRFRTTSEPTSVLVYEEYKKSKQSPIVMGVKDVLSAATVAMKSMGKNDYRYLLNSVHMCYRKGVVSFTGTNGHNASRSSITLEDKSHPDTSAIIPSDSIKYVCSLMRKHSDKNVRILTSKNSLEFDIEDGPTVTSPLVEGEYPTMAKLFTNEPIEPRRVIFSTCRDELVGAVDRISALSKESGNPVIVIKADAGKNNLVVHLPEDSHNERRKARDEVAITREEGYDEAILATFNGEYLSSLLQASTATNVKMAVATQGTRKQTIIDIDSEEPIDVIIMPIIT